MAYLKPQHEAFAKAFAASPNGAAAARAAGYAPSSAAGQAARLLRRSDVILRLAELDAEDEAARRGALAALTGKLEPVYDAALLAGDHDTVLQAVELQARISGLVQGGATIRPRRSAQGAARDDAGHESFLDELDYFDRQRA